MSRHAARHARCAADCGQCDAVCCRLTVVLADDDVVPEHLTTRLPSGVRVMAHAADGWCAALDPEHRNCGIYADRPDTCRRFVMNGPYCRSVRSEHQVHRAGKPAIPLLLR
jgi:Fe-S-cluster containining protein